VKNALLADIGRPHGKTAAQVALRWLVQRGIVAIPKSTHTDRMAQNLDLFDFALTDAEMEKIAALNVHDAGTVNFSDVNFVKYLIETYG
jgi:diketogulonate reductase-like aldo/keto reductase